MMNNRQPTARGSFTAQSGRPSPATGVAVGRWPFRKAACPGFGAPPNGEPAERVPRPRVAQHEDRPRPAPGMAQPRRRVGVAGSTGHLPEPTGPACGHLARPPLPADERQAQPRRQAAVDAGPGRKPDWRIRSGHPGRHQRSTGKYSGTHDCWQSWVPFSALMLPSSTRCG